MQMHQPIDITLRLRIPILHQQSRKLILRSIQPLPRQLQRQRLAAPDGGPVSYEIPDLGVEVGIQDGEGGEGRVEVGEAGEPGPEKVFEEVGRDEFVQPEEARLAVVDEVGAPLFYAAEAGPDAGRDD